MVELGFVTAEEKKTCILKLVNLMHGNVDAATKCFKLCKAHVTKPEPGVAAQQSQVDPRAFRERDKEGKTVLVAVAHADDNACTGAAKAVAWCEAGTRTRFDIEDLGKLKKHLGVWRFLGM